MEKFDIAVIGAGPGGYPAAIRAAQLGAKTAIIEKDLLGGTCLNRGCIPTKTLIAAASLYGELKHGSRIGVTAEKVAIDYGALSAHKDAVVTQLRDGVGQLLKANGITVFEGAASFKTRDRLTIKPAGGRAVTVSAAKVIIATGSEPVMPGFVPKHERVVDSTGFLELQRLPQSLVVLGGGYIGCELACLAAQLGVKVTIVELLDDILVQLDADVRKEIRRQMEGELGIRILTGLALEKIKTGTSGISGTVGSDTVDAELLLVAIGRRPCTGGLLLENAGVVADDRGYLRVNDHGRTAAATVYAVGDVTGKIQLAHAATSQGLVAAANACGTERSRNETLVPAVIFTVPEAATAGLTESEATERGLSFNTGKFHFRALGRALAANQSDGFVKWIADSETDELLGAAAVGPHATDLIAEAALAIRNELTAEELGNTIHAHPTFGEIWMEAAHAVHGTAIHAPPRRGKK